MKVHDCSKFGGESEKTRGSLLERLKSSHSEISAEERFISNLKAVLDQRFHLLCEVCLENQEDALPLILVGPSGLWLIQIITEKGVYRIGAEDWLQLDEKSGRNRSIQPNPTTNITAQAEKLANFLQDEHFSPQFIEPLIYFTHPGAHVEIDHPAVRIVLMDALNRLITRIITSPVVLDGDTIQGIVDKLVCVRETPEAIRDIQDAYSLRELPAPKKIRKPTRLEEMSRKEPGFVGRLTHLLPFSRQQWVLVGVLTVVNILIFLILVLVVVISSGS